MFAGIEKYTTFATANTGIAQLVEHRSPKPSVGSSSLSSQVAASLRLWGGQVLSVPFSIVLQGVIFPAVCLSDIYKFVRLQTQPPLWVP